MSVAKRISAKLFWFTPPGGLKTDRVAVVRPLPASVGNSTNQAWFRCSAAFGGIDLAPTAAGVHRSAAASLTCACVAWTTDAEAVVPMVAFTPSGKQSPAEPPAFVDVTSSMSLDLVMVSLPFVPLPSANVKVEPIVRQGTVALVTVGQVFAALSGD